MDYNYAQNFWERHDEKAVHMPAEALKARIDSFAASHNTLALATGYGTYVRCTPVEYTYYQDTFWIMSEGGKKFIGLEHNKNVSAAIFEPYNGFGSINGLQINGKAELIEPFSETYNSFLAYKKIPLDAIKKMAEPMPLIHIIPAEADYLDSSLKKEGYDGRQHLVY